jgi:hypothetical protein
MQTTQSLIAFDEKRLGLSIAPGLVDYRAEGNVNAGIVVPLRKFLHDL